jgi:hypothetical protein
LYKNIEQYNLHKILSDNIQYPYKNINAVNSIFSLYTTSIVSNLKNKDLPPKEKIKLLDHLIPAKIKEEETIETDLSTNPKPEDYSNNKYWISIDKYQYGSYSRTTSIKVLDKIEYICSEPSTRPQDLNCKNICGMSIAYSRENGIPSEGLEWTPSISDPAEIMKVNVKTDAFHLLAAEAGGNPTAIFTNVQVDQHKAAILDKYPNVQWEKIIYNRPDVRVSCGLSARDTVMYIREHYWISKNISSPGDPLRIRASDILDSTDNVLVRFQYRSRKLKHIDNFFKKYIINPNGSFTYDFRFGFDEMPIKNSFYSWFCNSLNRGTSTLETIIPPFYTMLNEMIFRGFFGSIDGLEIKNSTSKTQYPHEWIPYEYDNSVQCDFIGKPDTAPMSASSKPDSIGYKLRCWLLSKLVSTPYDKKKIVSNCLSYVQKTGGPGIVPDKKEFDYLYERKDTSIGRPRIQELINRFLG